MTCVVIGSQGALGKTVVDTLAQSPSTSLRIVSADVTPPPSSLPNNVTYVQLSKDGSPKGQTDNLAAVEKALGDNDIALLVCTAGGWAGGSLSQTDPEPIFAGASRMWAVCAQTALFTAVLAGRRLGSGLSIFLGAAVAAPKEAHTEGMIGYGMAKVATHHIVRSLAHAKKNALCLAPVTLDTQPNRAAMPNANRDTWTPLSDVAHIMVDWFEHPENRPPSGSIACLSTQDGKTTYSIE